MIRKISSLSLCAALMINSVASANDNKEAIASPITDFVSAIKKEAVHPKYPKRAAKKSQEGWVELSFTVEPDGSVANIIPVNHAGSKAFIGSATRALKQWQYEPATENGVPVQSCMHKVRLEFRIGANAVSSKFTKFFNRVIGVLNSGDIEAIRNIESEINNYQTKLFNEQDFIQILQLNYAKAINDLDLYDKRVEEIQLQSLKITAPKAWPMVAKRKLDIYLDQQKLTDAFNILEEFEQSKYSDLSKSDIEQMRNALVKFRDSDIQLVVDAKINDYGIWQHNLSRKSFALSKVNGNLQSVDVRCDNKRELYTANDNSKWKIPDSWQNCQLYITGDKQTTFELVEFPSAVDQDDSTLASD